MLIPDNRRSRGWLAKFMRLVLIMIDMGFAALDIFTFIHDWQRDDETVSSKCSLDLRLDRTVYIFETGNQRPFIHCQHTSQSAPITRWVHYSRLILLAVRAGLKNPGKACGSASPGYLPIAARQSRQPVISPVCVRIFSLAPSLSIDYCLVFRFYGAYAGK